MKPALYGNVKPPPRRPNDLNDANLGVNQLTPAQIRRAQLTVAHHSHTPDDCALLLDALGIGPGR